MSLIERFLCTQKVIECENEEDGPEDVAFSSSKVKEEDEKGGAGKDDLNQSLEDEGLIRNFGELSTDLFLSNPIERCFITKSRSFFDYFNPFRLCKKKKPSELPKNQTAAMLIDYVLNGSYGKESALL